jgi:hypothetical protein
MSIFKPGAKQHVKASRRRQGGGVQESVDQHQKAALDEALAESFPASDPVAVSISTAAPDPDRRIVRSSEPPT